MTANGVLSALGLVAILAGVLRVAWVWQQHRNAQPEEHNTITGRGHQP
ncbi:hypothetical protein [Gordonia rubripertincta]|nr:hypothetical protein [Gordonia rubripertincta]QMU22060.1 hypothetical protein H3V45_06095 [Gordonia rubripertincta]